MEVARILGVPFSTRGFAETVTDLVARIEAGKRTHVITANPEIVMVSRENSAFRSILEQAYVVPDGIGIVYAAKWLSLPITERVTGVELLEGLMEAADERAWKIYLLGAAPDVNEAAADQLAKRYPRANIIGRRHGFFDQKDERMIVSEIAELKPDLLFVALGAPRQDIWISTHWDKLQVPLAIGLGGSLDVISGKVKRAPELWQRMHLEWLYRLLSQPSRWKRQLAIPRFVFTVWREKWGKRT